MPFVEPTEDRHPVHHEDWAEGEEIYLAPEKPFWVTQRARERGVRAAPKGEPNDIGAHWQSIYADMVLGWNFKTPEGAEFKFNERNKRYIYAAYGEWLAWQIELLPGGTLYEPPRLSTINGKEADFRPSTDDVGEGDQPAPQGTRAATVPPGRAGAHLDGAAVAKVPA